MKKSKTSVAIVLTVVCVAVAVAVGLCGVVLYYGAEGLVDGLMSAEIPVDQGKEFFNKSGSPPEFFGENTGIVLPEGTKPVYMIHSEFLLPPYRLEAHLVIPKAEIGAFLRDNAFQAVPQRCSDLSFLRLTNGLPDYLQTPMTEGSLYIREHISNDAKIDVWWTYFMNADTGDLWIQYNTE